MCRLPAGRPTRVSVVDWRKKVKRFGRSGTRSNRFRRHPGSSRRHARNYRLDESLFLRRVRRFFPKSVPRGLRRPAVLRPPLSLIRPWHVCDYVSWAGCLPEASGDARPTKRASARALRRSPRRGAPLRVGLARLSSWLRRHRRTSGRRTSPAKRSRTPWHAPPKSSLPFRVRRL